MWKFLIGGGVLCFVILFAFCVGRAYERIRFKKKNLFHLDENGSEGRRRFLIVPAEEAAVFAGELKAADGEGAEDLRAVFAEAKYLTAMDKYAIYFWDRRHLAESDYDYLDLADGLWDIPRYLLIEDFVLEGHAGCLMMGNGINGIADDLNLNVSYAIEAKPYRK